MARAQNPDSANSQFFICNADANFLDGQYTLWGEVESGMEYVDALPVGEPPSDPGRIVEGQGVQGLKTVALITGASAGLGVEFARQLSKRGHALVLAARREDRIEALAERIGQCAGGRHRPVDKRMRQRN